MSAKKNDVIIAPVWKQATTTKAWNVFKLWTKKEKSKSEEKTKNKFQSRNNRRRCTHIKIQTIVTSHAHCAISTTNKHPNYWKKSAEEKEGHTLKDCIVDDTTPLFHVRQEPFDMIVARQSIKVDTDEMTFVHCSDSVDEDVENGN